MNQLDYQENSQAGKLLKGYQTAGALNMGQMTERKAFFWREEWAMFWNETFTPPRPR